MAARDPLADPERSIRRVYAYVAYRLGHGADAEDVTSQVIERALRYRATYDPNRGEPISWLIGIARTCIDDALRARRPETSAAPNHEHQPDFETDALQRLVVADAVATLEARDRELIALRYGADLSTNEIARVLELEPNAVDVALHRARTRLRPVLERSGLGRRRGGERFTQPVPGQVR